MGLRFRKSLNLGGGFKTTFSKSGVGCSWGTKGVRFTKKAGGGTRTTVSIPGTGISYVSDKSGDAGCLTIMFVWPIKFCWWMVIASFWLVWQMCYWLIIVPIAFLIEVVKNKKSQACDNSQNDSLNQD